MTTSPESKFTPGPWAAEYGTDGYYYLTHDGGCELGRDTEANAHLIASAPDLYEALKKAMPFIDDALDVVEVMSESVLTKECREVVKLARAAIAKAEGR